MTDPEQLLRDRFGFDSFRPGQREVIEHLLAGRSAAAVFPTGSGKSLCFQLPALALDGVTLVVSPLLALMKDQIDQLARRGIEAKRLDSTLSVDEYLAVMDSVRKGQLRLLYVAPERFNNERFRAAIQGTRIALMAIDEAHCISEWGHNFRPDYLKLPEIARRLGVERVLGLTATATPKVLEDMVRAFDIRSDAAVRTGLYRPNLRIHTEATTARARDGKLVALLKERGKGPTIVYVTQQREAERVATLLTAEKIPASAYHAGLKTEHRQEIQDTFMASETGVVVATIAFGMGVDKSDIRNVVHYNLPKSLEGYCQEIGRAGRDGEPSRCDLFVCPDDLNVLESFVYGDTPSGEALQGLTRELFESDEAELVVSEHDLGGRHDIRPLVVRTILTYLELEGYLEGGTPFYDSYRFKPKAPSSEILARFEGEERDLLRAVFKRAKKGRLWFSLDVDAIGKEISVPRGRIVAALEGLHETQLIELEGSAMRRRYRRLRQTDSAELAATLEARVERQERGELDRLGQVLALVTADECQTAVLCRHFGEEREAPCGHCTYCETGSPTEIPPRPSPAIDDVLWNRAEALRSEHPEALADPRALARFLCGVTSPRTSRAKLRKHSLFGAFTGVPFGEVLARAGARCRP